MDGAATWCLGSRLRMPSEAYRSLKASPQGGRSPTLAGPLFQHASYATEVRSLTGDGQQPPVGHGVKGVSDEAALQPAIDSLLNPAATTPPTEHQW